MKINYDRPKIAVSVLVKINMYPEGTGSNRRNLKGVRTVELLTQCFQNIDH